MATEAAATELPGAVQQAQLKDHHGAVALLITGVDGHASMGLPVVVVGHGNRGRKHPARSFTLLSAGRERGHPSSLWLARSLHAMHAKAAYCFLFVPELECPKLRKHRDLGHFRKSVC